MQARQTRKIEQLREVFLTNGRLSVKEQAELLGLCRSTAHAVLQRSYKKSGLSKAIIKRMLACPRLPERARTIILEYIAERIRGSYGHTRSQRRRFMAALATALPTAPFTLLLPPASSCGVNQDISST
jgi:hypothetical protein